jgi:hypothetical protein
MAITILLANIKTAASFFESKSDPFWGRARTREKIEGLHGKSWKTSLRIPKKSKLKLK